MDSSPCEVNELRTTWTWISSLKWLAWVEEIKRKHSVAIWVSLGESRVLSQLVRRQFSILLSLNSWLPLQCIFNKKSFLPVSLYAWHFSITKLLLSPNVSQALCNRLWHHVMLQHVTCLLSALPFVVLTQHWFLPALGVGGEGSCSGSCWPACYDHFRPAGRVCIWILNSWPGKAFFSEHNHHRYGPITVPLMLCLRISGGTQRGSGLLLRYRHYKWLWYIYIERGG